jgi:hypothetical protein
MENVKTTKSIEQEPICRVARALGFIRELHRWSNCCRAIATFTGGP